MRIWVYTQYDYVYDDIKFIVGMSTAISIHVTLVIESATLNKYVAYVYTLIYRPTYVSAPSIVCVLNCV